MTAPNHALTGALIGLTITNPLIALPLAFVSHFACDLIPHYDPPEQQAEKRIISKRFIWEFLVVGATLCLLLVIVLAIARPHNWLQAAVCAFLATSPDLFWIPRFVYALRTNKDLPPRTWLMRFHQRIQWKTGPQLWAVEVVWALLIGTFVVIRL